VNPRFSQTIRKAPEGRQKRAHAFIPDDLRLMKIKEIRDMTLQELQTRRRDIKQEQFHLRMQQQAGQMEKPSQLRSLRRDVARIETIISQRRLAATKAAAPTPSAATV
jgi:large subunit ribosomal protein L29